MNSSISWAGFNKTLGKNHLDLAENEYTDNINKYALLLS